MQTTVEGTKYTLQELRKMRSRAKKQAKSSKLGGIPGTYAYRLKLFGWKRKVQKTN